MFAVKELRTIIVPLFVIVPLSVMLEFLMSVPPLLIVVELTVVLAVRVIVEPLGITTLSYVPGMTAPTQAAVVLQVNEPVFAVIVFETIIVPLFVVVPPRVALELRTSVPPLLMVVE